MPGIYGPLDFATIFRSVVPGLVISLSQMSRKNTNLIRIQTDSKDARAKNNARHQSSGYLYKNRSLAGTARAVIVQQISKQIVNTPFLIACLFPSRFHRRSTSLLTIGWDTRSILSSLIMTSSGCLAFNPCRISSDDGTI